MRKDKIIGYGGLIVVSFSVLTLFFPPQLSAVKQGLLDLFTNFAANWWLIFPFIGMIFLFIFILYYGITFFGLLEKTPAPKEYFFPNISIMICSKSEKPLLKQTLDSLIASDYPKEKMQVILVTSDSDDGSEVFCEDYATQHPGINWKVINDHVEKPGKPPALNVGLKHVLHDYLVLYDAGNILMPDTLKNLLAPMKDDKVHAIMGSIQVSNWNRNKLTKSIVLDYAIVSGGNTFFEAKTKMGLNCYLYGRNVCIRMDVLREIGGFEEAALTEDLHLGSILNVRKKTLTFTPHAKIYEPVPADWKILTKQRMRWVGGFMGDAPRIVKMKEGDNPVGKKVIISRFITMQLFGNLTTFLIVALIFLIINLSIQEYYMAIWDAIYLVFFSGIVFHSLQKYGDKRYGLLLYYLITWRIHMTMASWTSKLPENISWQQTPMLLSMSKEELADLSQTVTNGVKS